MWSYYNTLVDKCLVNKFDHQCILGYLCTGNSILHHYILYRLDIDYHCCSTVWKRILIMDYQ